MNKKNKYNIDAIKTVIKKYGYSKVYIYKCLNHSVDGLMPDKVRKDYDRISRELEKTLKKELDNIID